MNSICVWLLLLLAGAAELAAQGIRVNPKGVNVNSAGATTVFLTFGGVGSRRAAEATWCGELIPADPDVGLRCNPATIYGSLPARYDRGTPSGSSAYTDVMSIPASVARRAYQAAQGGAEPRFFYVRRFVSPSGGPDEYVDVTCRLTAGGARTPLALTDVKLGFAAEPPVPFIRPGDTLPPLSAQITYTGTGRLRGRWEIVLPGEELPSERDLLTEATLPAEDRGSQRRYTELARFNVFLPPTSTHVLPGPVTRRLPTHLEGMYLVLLRIEASDDKEGDSDLSAVGAGAGIVHSGAVAGFPLPTLRYFVGSGDTPALRDSAVLRQLVPDDSARISDVGPVEFRWAAGGPAAIYRLEVETSAGEPVLAALLPPRVGSYRAPPWLWEKAADESVRWRVLALGHSREPLAETPWRTLTRANPKAMSGFRPPFRLSR